MNNMVIVVLVMCVVSGIEGLICVVCVCFGSCVIRNSSMVVIRMMISVWLGMLCRDCIILFGVY